MNSVFSFDTSCNTYRAAVDAFVTSDPFSVRFLVRALGPQPFPDTARVIIPIPSDIFDERLTVVGGVAQLKPSGAEIIVNVGGLARFDSTEVILTTARAYVWDGNIDITLAGCLEDHPMRHLRTFRFSEAEFDITGRTLAVSHPDGSTTIRHIVESHRDIATHLSGMTLMMHEHLSYRDVTQVQPRIFTSGSMLIQCAVNNSVYAWGIEMVSLIDHGVVTVDMKMAPGTPVLAGWGMQPQIALIEFSQTGTP